MAGEGFSWREGQVWLWTGAGATSAAPAYAQNTRLAVTRGYDNRPSVSGVYRDHLISQRADVAVGAVYAFDGTLEKIHESATAVHMKLLHSSVNGSAGYVLYSGRIDALEFNGTEGAPYKWSMQYHANIWSAF